MLIYVDILSDKEIASDSYPESQPCKGIKAIESKRITISNDVGIAANADDEEEGATADALEDEQQTVIDIVYGSKLSKIDLSKKEFKSLIMAYFKKVMKALAAAKYKLLDLNDEEEKPTKEAEAAAIAELSKYDKLAFDELQKKIDTFSANFPTVSKFVQDEILGNFDEYEFYTVEEGELDSCMLIPARYVGEAVAPVFYIFEDGTKSQKQ